MINEMDNFLRALRLRVSGTTHYRKKWQLRSFYKYLFNHNLHYSEADQHDVEHYLLSLCCSQPAKQQICTVIRDFYEFIKCEDNPAKNIRFIKDKSKKLPKVPSQAVVESIIRKLSIDNRILSLRNKLLVELAYGSGLRRLELVKLDIDDIDLENRTVYVKGKGGRTRIVPITGKAVESLREYLSTRQAYRGPLFLSFSGRRLGPGSIYWVLKNKAGIRPHLLRHACAGHMLKNGCSIRIIQELLGHKDLKATQVYTQINKQDLMEVINKKHPRNLKHNVEH